MSNIAKQNIIFYTILVMLRIANYQQNEYGTYPPILVTRRNSLKSTKVCFFGERPRNYVVFADIPDLL